MTDLRGKNIVLGVTGGIAAYKSCDLVSRLIKLGAHVDVIMTKNACEFVRPLVFQTLSGNPVVQDTFQTPDKWEVEHVSLAQKADLMVVAPATANMLAKMANGIADDMLSTTLLAARSPVLVAPAMNTAMYEHSATRENIARLRARGVLFVGPAGGRLACGDIGLGRMSEPEDIIEAALAALSPKDYQGVRVLVTAGATREMLDPVRFLTNRSTGKMGYAIASAALRRGAEVCLVSGKTALKAPACEAVSVQSTEELAKAVLSRAPQMDVIIQAAAPADFTVETPAQQKIKKKGEEGLTVHFSATTDVAKAVGRVKKQGQVLVGFAAETNDVQENAKKKLVAKDLDMIVANDVSKEDAGFAVDTNAVTLITGDGVFSYPVLPKAEVADLILDQAIRLFRQAR